MSSASTAAVHEFVCDANETGALRVARFRGLERISATFRFTIVLRADCDDAAALERGLLGQRASLSIGGRWTGRTIAGLIERVRVRGLSADRADVPHCKVELVPRLRLLAQRVNSRIFQKQTVLEIVDTLLDGFDIPRSWKISHDYVRRDYCVQYQETDLAFLERTLAEDGIFYYFEHGSDLPRSCCKRRPSAS